MLLNAKYKLILTKKKILGCQYKKSQVGSDQSIR